MVDSWLGHPLLPTHTRMHGHEEQNLESMEAPMAEDQDLSYLDLLALRALLISPLLAWALLFYVLL